MIRNLKMVGLLALAALATSAMMASAAQAEVNGVLTGGETPSTHENVTLVGTQYGEEKDNVFIFTEGEEEAVELHCENKGVHYTGTFKGTAKEIKVIPTYQDCYYGELGTGLAATVNTNGCEFLFTQPTKTGGGEYTGPADLTCPEGEAIEIKVFAFGTPTGEHFITGCTIEVFADDHEEGGHDIETLGGHVTYKNEVTIIGETEHDDVTINATIVDILYSQSGVGCENKEDDDGTLDSRVTLRAFDDEFDEPPTLHTELRDLWFSDEA